jgi:hypothetical protein
MFSQKNWFVLVNSFISLPCSLDGHERVKMGEFKMCLACIHSCGERTHAAAFLGTWAGLIQRTFKMFLMCG